MHYDRAQIARCCLSLCFFFLTISVAGAAAVPALRGRVNDYAQILTPEQSNALDAQLARLEQDTGHQVAVLTLPSLDGEDIEGFSIRVAENWKIGKKGFDNGVILIVAVNDRKLRLEVGYGLEGSTAGSNRESDYSRLHRAAFPQR